MARQFVAACVQGHGDALAEAPAHPFQLARVFQCDCSEHGPVGSRCKHLDDVIHGSQPAARLHRTRRITNCFEHEAAVRANSGLGAIEVDDVKPPRTRLCEAERDLYRIVAVDGFRAETTLQQPDTLAL
jgi:hypothetical protein